MIIRTAAKRHTKLKNARAVLFTRFFLNWKMSLRVSECLFVCYINGFIVNRRVTFVILVQVR
jgi:hypothetical protein